MARFGLYLSGAQFRVGGFEFVPDGFEDGGEWSDADAGPDQHADLVVEHVFTGCPKGPVHPHPEKQQGISQGEMLRSLIKSM